MIEITAAVFRAMEGHAREAFPEECCGFLLGHVSEPRRVEEAKRAKNVAVADRTRRYEIDPLELLHADDDARTRGLDLVGIYHSHPNHPAAPSEFDGDRRARNAGPLPRTSEKEVALTLFKVDLKGGSGLAISIRRGASLNPYLRGAEA